MENGSSVKKVVAPYTPETANLRVQLREVSCNQNIRFPSYQLVPAKRRAEELCDVEQPRKPTQTKSHEPCLLAASHQDDVTGVLFSQGAESYGLGSMEESFKAYEEKTVSDVEEPEERLSRYAAEPDWEYIFSRCKSSRNASIFRMYEITRMSQTIQTAVERRLFDDAVVATSEDSHYPLKFRDVWIAIRDEYQRLSGKTLSSDEPDFSVFNRLEDLNGDEDCANLSAALTTPKEEVYLTLQPLKLEENSTEFTRKYGSRRFLSVYLPKVPSKRSDESSEQSDKLNNIDRINDIIKKFRQDGFTFLGRNWKQFFYREVQKKDGKEGFGRYRLVMAAVSGHGIQPTSTSRMFSWYIDPELNRGIPCCKLFTRLALGFSRTIPTICLEADEISEADDILSTEGNVMNNGSGTATRAIFRDIQMKLGLGSEIFALQFRMPGVKGVLVRDPNEDPLKDERRVTIYKSQTKFRVNDERVAQINILETFGSKPTKTSSLSRQIISILSNNEVPNEVFGELMKESLGDYIKPLKTCEDSNELLRWLGEWRHRRNDFKPESTGLTEIEDKVEERLEERLEEKALLLICSGSTLKTCGKLREVLQRIVSSRIKHILSQHHIPLQRSARVLCQPDYTGTLREGEVCITFSTPGQEPLSGNILVGREPAYTESDVQRVTAVECPSLSQYQNILFCSIQGPRSLLSVLSGGDYDGDKVIVIWDERVVSKFKSKAENLPSVEEFFDLPKEPKTFNDMFCEAGGDVDKAIENLIHIENGNVLGGASLGLISNFHERLAYHIGLEHPLTKTTAGIVTTVMDGTKSGHVLKEKEWENLVERFPKYTNDIPAYKADKMTVKEFRKKQSKMKKDKRRRMPLHPLDYIGFEIVPKIEDTFNQEFNLLYPGSPQNDVIEKLYTEYSGSVLDFLTSTVEKHNIALANHPDYEQALTIVPETSANLKSLEGMPLDLRHEFMSELAKKRQLLQLQYHLKDIVSSWVQFFMNQDETWSDDVKKDKTDKLKKDCKRRFEKILPDEALGSTRCWLNPRDISSDWSKLKASALYARNKELAWKVAANTLRIIHADAAGKSWTPVQMRNFTGSLIRF